MRVLDARTIATRMELQVVGNAPERFLCVNGSAQWSEADAYSRASAFAVEAGTVTGKTVAWIGGGFCIGPRVFAIADCHQVVFEIEPALREFCPEGVDFRPGDYRETFTGTYDVIVYDLGGEVPREMLERHLKPGGVILPKEG